MSRDQVIIAHRGASGYLPEHTLAGYAMAYALGADFIEPDLVATRDGVLICCHDIHLDRTTDVATRYPERARADGRWYAADFTWAEVRTLAAIERVDADGQRVFPGRFDAGAHGFGVPCFDALLTLVAALNRQSGRAVGVYPETKSPAFHEAEGLALEPRLLGQLSTHGFSGPGAPVFVQSFSADSLRTLRALGCTLPLIQLIDGNDSAHVSPAGLDAVAAYANGIGPDKARVAADDGALVTAAHARGLVVHAYTFRADAVGAGYADLTAELTAFADGYGVDGVFTDFCDIAAALFHPERFGPLRAPSPHRPDA